MLVAGIAAELTIPRSTDPLVAPSAADWADRDALWHVRPWLEFHWRDWGSDSVVFELRSGQTYQVDALTAAVMACLDEAPRSIGEVERLIAADLGVADEREHSAELRVAIGAALRKLVALRWIEATAT